MWSKSQRNKTTALTHNEEYCTLVIYKPLTSEGKKCGKTAHMSKDCRSKETSAFEAGDELAETGCIEMASVDWNALEIGAVLLPESQNSYWNRFVCCSDCFPRVLRTTVLYICQAKRRVADQRQASLFQIWVCEVQVKLRDGSLRYVNPGVSYTHRALMAVSEMNDVGPDVFFPRSDRGIKAYAYHESSGTKLELERVNGVLGLPVELVPHSQRATAHSGPYSSLSALEHIKDMMSNLSPS